MQPMLDYNAMAQLFVAGLSATMQAMQTWIQFQDRRKAGEDFDQLQSAITPEVENQATAIVLLIPDEVLKDLTRRSEECWLKYRRVLGAESKYLEEEIDEATEAVKHCVCRELRRIESLNGDLPPGIMQRYWAQYRCHEKSV